MSLFVGNVSKNVSLKDLEEEFMKFGTCKVNHRGSYAFIEYPDEQDAEDARMTLNSKNMGGLCLNIEWSKRSTRYDPNRSNRPAGRVDRSKERCYKCGQPGHISKDCKYALHREAPDCYECGGKGHIAKDCPQKRHRSPPRRRSPSPVSPRPRRRSSSERSFSLERPVAAMNLPPPIHPPPQPASPREEDLEDDLVFPSEQKQADTPETKVEPTEASQEERHPPVEILESDGTRFFLVTPNVEEEYCGYRCEVCGKTLQRANIKKHIATKTHKDRMATK